MSYLDFLLIDADNHYYEAEDAFLRYGDDSVREIHSLGAGRQEASAGVRRSSVVRASEPDLQPRRQAGRLPQSAEGARGGKGAIVVRR